MRILNLSTNDAFAQLAEQKLRRSIPAMERALSQRGSRVEINTILWPEFGITRNEHRWREGFPYGVLYWWDNNDQSFVALSARPNACGAMVGRLEKPFTQ